jgi:2-C-methyl-D-erythritol 4-phosphate cytidylyltransferase / 2-C-methyl-D-erythritol 2,4-cyclodiphosphate synthase
MRSLLPKVALIIPAAGSGERFGAPIPKALVQLNGRTLIEHAILNLGSLAAQIIVAAPAGFEDQFKNLLGDAVTVVTGGSTRTKSVKIALESIDPEVEYILVHDAARPLASTELGEQVIAALLTGEVAVIPALSVADTIKEVDASNYVVLTPNRERLRAVQTPQGFARETLTKAHTQNIEATDDGSLVEAMRGKVKLITGEDRALKITNPEDLASALKYLVPAVAADIRTGVGIDAHAFSSDPKRELWLAGLRWENEIGVDGHSDGDVAAHAICDALFAAANLGDLGSNFGSAKPEYAGASGARLLSETLKLITSAGFAIQNISVQIIGNRPKIGPHRLAAIAKISQALGGAKVSVSATTTDGLGLTGEGKGIGAIATALIIRSESLLK